jgi:hypothetical protein
VPLRLEHAVWNNVMWYEAVTGAYGIQGELSEHHWSSADAVPPYYSNLVTRTHGEDGTRAQLRRIRELAASPPKPDWGLKDSFARLELEELGLRVLFDAHWFGLEAGAASEPETDVELAPVESAAELERWERAWQLSSPAPGLRIFPPALLSHADVAFLAARRGTQLIGGAATNLSEGCVGLSNVFALDELSAAFHRDCARAAQRLCPERAVVGYGSRSELDDLAALGFRDLGPLRVWVAS